MFPDSEGLCCAVAQISTSKFGETMCRRAVSIAKQGGVLVLFGDRVAGA